MSGEQLERSILERKEREELKAIATAMSLEPVARTKKADLVDQILRAAGVEVNKAGASNGAAASANTPASRAAGRSGGGLAASDGVTPAPAGDAGSDASAGVTAGVTDESANGKAPRSRATRSRTPKPKAATPDVSVAPGDAESTPGADVTQASGTAAGGSALDEAASSPVVRTGHSADAAGGAAAGGGDSSGDDSTAGRRPPRRSAAASKRSAPSNGAGSLTEASPEGDAGATARSASSAAAPPASSPSPGADAPPAVGGPTPASGEGATAAPVADRSGSYAPSQQRPQRQQSDRQQSDRQQGHNQGNQGNQAHQGNQANQGNQQGEAGNRRGRRRRGRERERGGELQGSGQPDNAWQGELVPVKGLVDLREEGYGFLRTSGYLASAKDVYVSVNQARRFALRRGDALEGACRPAGPSEKYPALLRIDTVNGMTPEEARERPRFEDLTPLFPDERLRLESSSDPSNVTARIIDLISPIGKGQRGMIVSPSKAGKTTIMKQIAHSVELNNPDVHLMVLLVDERPEEVTDMRRSVKGEVIASTFDRPADEHTALSELTMERAKRLVEMGQDVVIILDGITRLARAYNLAQPATGRIMSGGVDSGALYPPKKFFGAARNVEEGGSLTILATALIETGSKMDEVIFEEFKGTGNMELRLDRKLAERRVYPAIDVNASSTRHEELLFDRSQLQQVWKLRRVLNALGAEGSAAAGLELLMDKIKTTRSNDEFLAEIAKAPTPSN